MGSVRGPEWVGWVRKMRGWGSMVSHEVSRI